MPKVAILLATYNGKSFIKKQVDTILNQKDIDVTIYVSDDLSTDGTLEYLQKTYPDNNIVYLPSSQKFGGAAMNFYRLIKDVDFNKFDFISLSDQDDIWNENKIIHSINSIIERDVDIYSSNVTAFWENGKEVLINKSQEQKKYDHLFSSAGPGCTYVMKKDFLSEFKKVLIKKETSLNDIDLHDWLLYAFARINNYKWYVDNNTTMLYRQHATNEFGANSGFKAFKSRWNKARNGWYRSQIINVAKFCDCDNKITKAINKNRYVDRIFLLTKIFNLRKKISEVIVLFFILIIPGFK